MSLGEKIGRGRVAEVFEWKGTLAVKLFYPTISRETVDHEFRVSKAVHETGVRSPAIYELIEVGDRLGIVCERLRGSSMLDLLSAHPEQVIRAATTLAELQADLHSKAVSGLPSFRQHFENDIASADALSAAQKEACLEILHKLPDGDSLCHGDFHPDNVFMRGKDAVILDWTTAATGNPAADAARTSLILRLGELPPGTPLGTRILVGVGRHLFHSTYLSRYLKLQNVRRAELEAWRLPVAAARLAAEIPQERTQLLGIVERCLHGR